ncbi:hypothetical protein [Lactiplantibacillus plantarum]|nr:hypothetical protein [Lactiplantibacillus plantarum]
MILSRFAFGQELSLPQIAPTGITHLSGFGLSISS